MQPKWLFALCLTLLTQIALAETCPTVSAIKHGALNGWQVYDSDDNKPLTAKRLADFKKSIRQFVLAEWKENTAQRGIMRCYYVDGDGSELEAYVAKNHFLPNPSGYSRGKQRRCKRNNRQRLHWRRCHGPHPFRR